MADTLRKKIVDNLKSTLEGITIGNGFRTGVNTVESVLRHWDDISSEIRPWIGFVAGREIFQYQPSFRMRVTLPFTLAAYLTVTGTGDTAVDNRESEITKLHDDIIVALNADQSRGGNAVMTTIRTVETDEGEDRTCRGGGDGVLIMTFEVVYHRTTSAT